MKTLKVFFSDNLEVLKRIEDRLLTKKLDALSYTLWRMEDSTGNMDEESVVFSIKTSMELLHEAAW